MFPGWNVETLGRVDRPKQEVRHEPFELDASVADEDRAGVRRDDVCAGEHGRSQDAHSGVAGSAAARIGERGALPHLQLVRRSGSRRVPDRRLPGRGGERCRARAVEPGLGSQRLAQLHPAGGRVSGARRALRLERSGHRARRHSRLGRAVSVRGRGRAVGGGARADDGDDPAPPREGPRRPSRCGRASASARGFSRERHRGSGSRSRPASGGPRDGRRTRCSRERVTFRRVVARSDRYLRRSGFRKHAAHGLEYHRARPRRCVAGRFRPPTPRRLERHRQRKRPLAVGRPVSEHGPRPSCALQRGRGWPQEHRGGVGCSAQHHGW